MYFQNICEKLLRYIFMLPKNRVCYYVCTILTTKSMIEFVADKLNINQFPSRPDVVERQGTHFLLLLYIIYINQLLVIHLPQSPRRELGHAVRCSGPLAQVTNHLNPLRILWSPACSTTVLGTSPTDPRGQNLKSLSSSTFL